MPQYTNKYCKALRVFFSYYFFQPNPKVFFSPWKKKKGKEKENYYLSTEILQKRWKRWERRCLPGSDHTRAFKNYSNVCGKGAGERVWFGVFWGFRFRFPDISSPWAFHGKIPESFHELQSGKTLPVFNARQQLSSNDALMGKWSRQKERIKLSWESSTLTIIAQAQGMPPTGGVMGSHHDCKVTC